MLDDIDFLMVLGNFLCFNFCIRYWGACPWRALYTIVSNLNIVLYLIGSQHNFCRHALFLTSCRLAWLQSFVLFDMVWL